MIKLSQVFYLNEIGKRSNLEDSIFPKPGEADISTRLFLVCDGVGGHNKGEEASRIVSTSLGQSLKDKKEITQADVSDALHAVHKEMEDYISIHPDAAKMSTTLTLAAIGKSTILIAWCGDSRIVHVRDGNIIYKSLDHSLVMELVKQGKITEEEAATHPQRNLILRSVNAEKAFTEPEFHLITNIKDGDWLLLCTDGMFENLSNDAISAILGPGNVGQQELQSAFYNLCNDKTNDNYSLYLIQLKNDSTKFVRPPIHRPAPGKDNKALYALLFVLLVLCIYWGIKLITHHSSPPQASAQPSSIANALRPNATDPSFPGGDSAWIQYGRTEVHYPKAALKHKKQGRATIRFMVSASGVPDSFQNLSHLGYGLEKELKRVISGSTWLPATANNKPVEDTLIVGWQFVLPDSIGGGVHPF